MQIHIIAIGSKMPQWVKTGYDEYAKRLPVEMSLNLIELPLKRPSKNPDLPRLLNKEGELMLAAIPKNSKIVALDERGRRYSTLELSEQFRKWSYETSNISLLIGGPDGLAPECRKIADASWSLSPLTLPHPLVRIVLAEQIYRVYSLLRGHPYHRE